MVKIIKATLRVYMERQVEIEVDDDFDGYPESHILRLHKSGDMQHGSDADTWQYIDAEVTRMSVEDPNDPDMQIVSVKQAHKTSLWETKPVFHEFPSPIHRVEEIVYNGDGYYSIFTREYVADVRGGDLLMVKENQS